VKKSFFLALILAFICFSFCTKPNKPSCPFCNDEILAYQSFYQDELVLGLYTHKPATEGHCLIIPRRHVERFENLTEDEITQIAMLVKKTQNAISKAFNKDKYLLLQKNGKEVGQSVPHVHFHIIPAEQGKSANLFWAQFAISDLFSPINSDQMEENILKIQANL